MNLFNEDSLLGRILDFTGKMILLNLLWIFCSIPVITIGASTSALYYAAFKLRMDPESSPLKNFIKSFKQNFLQASAIWILLLAFAGLLFLESRWLLLSGNTSSILLCFALAGVGILWVVLAFYIFPVIAAFRNRMIKLTGHAFYFAFHKPLYLLAVLLITCMPMYFTLVDAGLFPVYVFIWLMAGFAVTAYVNSWFLLKLFTPWLEQARERGGENRATGKNTIIS